MFKKMLVLMMGSNLVLHMVGHWQEHYHSSNISFNYHQMTTLIMNGELLQNNTAQLFLAKSSSSS